MTAKRIPIEELEELSAATNYITALWYWAMDRYDIDIFLEEDDYGFTDASWRMRNEIKENMKVNKMTKKKKLLFVTDGTEFSDKLIHELEKNGDVELIIRTGAEEGYPILRTDKGRFQGEGIMFYIENFLSKGE